MSSPKKGTKTFTAWVEDLKIEIEHMHTRPNSVTVYTDGAYHHSDHKAAFAFTIFQDTTWHDSHGWCPAASSFDAELCAIEAALEHVTTRSSQDHVTIIIDNKAAANALFNFEVKSSQMSVVRINMLLYSWLASDHLFFFFFLTTAHWMASSRAASSVSYEEPAGHQKEKSCHRPSW